MNSKSKRRILAEELAAKDGHQWENLATDGKPNWKEVYLHAADTAIEAEAREEAEKNAKNEAQLAEEASHASQVDIPEEPYSIAVNVELNGKDIAEKIASGIAEEAQNSDIEKAEIREIEERVQRAEAVAEAVVDAEKARIAAIANGQGEPDDSITGTGKDDKATGSGAAGQPDKPQKPKKGKSSGKSRR